MIYYFSLLVPICLIYMAKYYTLKHDHEELKKYYGLLLLKNKKGLNESKKNEK